MAKAPAPFPWLWIAAGAAAVLAVGLLFRSPAPPAPSPSVVAEAAPEPGSDVGEDSAPRSAAVEHVDPPATVPEPPPVPSIAPPTVPSTSEDLARLLALAVQAKARRQYVQAENHLRRATEVDSVSVAPRVALSALFLETGDWPRAEDAARDALRTDNRSKDAWRILGYALLRQDRNAEAWEALRTALDFGDDEQTRNLLARIEKEGRDERGMTEQRLSHFHVRYDGDAHESVGREVLRLLERHHATLTTQFGQAPATTIPVILFSRQGYYTASGAPAWSGGNYDGFDGRIRLPIGGLTERLDPELDNTLLHELVHAFIADHSRGLAPREFHEGVAQYLEGKRTGMHRDSTRRAMAAGQLRSVGGFYLRALSLAEYLYGHRGQGGINEVLGAMAATGNVDAAFQQVYGNDFGSVRAAWLARARQESGAN